MNCLHHHHHHCRAQTLLIPIWSEQFHCLCRLSYQHLSVRKLPADASLWSPRSPHSLLHILPAHLSPPYRPLFASLSSVLLIHPLPFLHSHFSLSPVFCSLHSTPSNSPLCVLMKLRGCCVCMCLCTRMPVPAPPFSPGDLKNDGSVARSHTRTYSPWPGGELCGRHSAPAGVVYSMEMGFILSGQSRAASCQLWALWAVNKATIWKKILETIEKMCLFDKPVLPRSV